MKLPSGCLLWMLSATIGAGAAGQQMQNASNEHGTQQAGDTRGPAHDNVAGTGAARPASTSTAAALPPPLPGCDDYVLRKPGGDHTDPANRDDLAVVEQFHFTRDVATLTRGTSGPLGGDIGYTLEHFPTHHRALAAMSRLALRERRERPNGARYTVNCYFERAIRFRPADAKVRALYAHHLLTTHQHGPALAQLEQAALLDPQNAAYHYNLGLLYVNDKQYDKARSAARQAYQLGNPLPGLRTQLIAAGQWQE